MRLKIVYLALILVANLNSYGQKEYFQQKTNYQIQASLNREVKTISGLLSVDYYNASPDTLPFIWFHIWPNAYANSNSALGQAIQRDKELKKTTKKAEPGYLDSLNFTQNGTPLRTAPHPEHIDIIKVYLEKAVMPGTWVTVKTSFKNKLPAYFSRSGFSEEQFVATQWYPKPAVYDREGWHPMPYLDMGEYYANFGDFKVSLTVPDDMVIAASGTLQNTDELNAYKTTGLQNNNKDLKSGKQVAFQQKGTKTLDYLAENVHDFAWFAMNTALVQYDTCMLSSGKIIDVFTYYRPESRTEWVNAMDYLKAGIRFYSQELGEYPHPQVSAAQGPRNVNSGGMEYPMITLITVPEKEMNTQLESTIVHEAGHNWFQGVLGTNERKYPWFDEGFNTFYQMLYEARQGKNSIFGDRLPPSMANLPANEFFNIVMQTLASIPFTYPVNTPSGDYNSKQDYGVTAYFKGAVWLYFLRSRMGVEKFEKGMKAFYNTWKFRHPAPADFQAIMEQTAGYSLKETFELLETSGKISGNKGD